MRRLRHFMAGSVLLILGHGQLYAQSGQIAAPTITTQPMSLTIAVGETATFSVTATSDDPAGIDYQWRIGQVDIAGATGSTYTITNAQRSDQGIFSVKVSNAGGDTISDFFFLVVRPGLTAFFVSPAAVDLGSDNQSVTFRARTLATIPADILTGNNIVDVIWKITRPDGMEVTKSSMVEGGEFVARLSVADTATGKWLIDSATAKFANEGKEDVVYDRARLARLQLPTSFFSGYRASFETHPSDLSVTGGFWIEVDVRVTAERHSPVEWHLVLPDRILEPDSKIYTPSDEMVAAKLLFGPIVAGDAGDFRIRATNRFGPTDSNPRKLTVKTAVPERSRYVGDRTILSFPVGTWGHFKYQWQKDGFDIPGATDANLVIDPVRLNDAGLYSVRVRYPLRTSSTGHLLRLSVSPAPVAPAITSQPAAATVEEGTAASFSVSASGDAPLSYQWSKDGGAIAGATGATYAIAAAWLGDAGSYSVVVRNAAGSVTSAATVLTVTPGAPTITAQPASATVVEGEAASFSVTATGTAPLTYQWSKDGTDIPGATDATYAIASVWPNNAGSYAVVVSNVVDSVTSAAAVLTVTASPTITDQPASATVVAGEAASFSVVVTGTAPFTYQWSRNTGPIAGATDATYAIAEVQLGDAGWYVVAVSNAVGSVTSSAAVLTVTEAPLAPRIIFPPAAATVVEGEAASFTVVATGNAPLSWQWSKDGSPIAGATDSTYAIAAAWLADAGSYAVTVSNEVGSVTSAAAVLTVEAVAPAITAQPAAIMVVEGDAASFSVVATGTAPLSYQWSRDGSPIAGATSSTYEIASAWPNDAGSYAVTVSNAVGSVTSSAAVLTVTEAAVAPEITAQPAAATVVEGEAASFSVVATGTAPLTYQWSRDGTEISGATGATYEIAAAWLNDAGSYAVVVSNEAGSATSAAAVLTVTEASSVLSNISVRTTLEPSQVLLVGAVVAGGSRNLLVRAAGPALDGLGLTGLPDPEFTLYDSAGAVIGANDDWNSALADTFASVGAFPFTAGSADSAHVLAADGAFTVHVSGKDGEGTVLVEAYDLPGTSGARLSNVSARNFAGTGDDMFIAGFAIDGTRSHRVLIRVIGPALGEGFLVDPTMTLFDRDGDAIMSNDDWGSELVATFAVVGAFPLPAGSKDAALVAELAPGSYTVQAQGADGATGEALVEIYEILE